MAEKLYIINPFLIFAYRENFSIELSVSNEVIYYFRDYECEPLKSFEIFIIIKDRNDKDNSIVVRMPRNLIQESSLYFCENSTSYDYAYTITGLDSLAVLMVLEFFSTALPIVQKETISIVFEAAHMLGAHEYIFAILSRLDYFIDVNNCIEVENITAKLGYQNYSNRIKFFIEQNFSLVMAQREFLKIRQEQLVRYLRSDDLVVEDEQEIFDAVVRWINYDFPMRSNNSVDVWLLIRFPMMNMDNLSLREEHSWIFMNMYVYTYLNDAMNYSIDKREIPYCPHNCRARKYRRLQIAQRSVH